MARIDAPLWLVHAGRVDYEQAWSAMRAYTEARDADSPDQIWLLEHPPVFTLGYAGREEHLLSPGDTPLVRVDRGGQITWHGPGQLVAYLLLDLKRLGYGVRELVARIERALIALLAEFGIDSSARSDAPGVYVDGAKIAALGLKVKRGCSYHGLSLNVDCGMEDFQRINPCGYQGLDVVRMIDLLDDQTPDLETIGNMLVGHLLRELEINPGNLKEMEWQYE